MKNNRGGGGILILILLLTTFGFLYLRYFSFQNLELTCLSSDEIAVLNFKGEKSKLYPLEDDCFRLLDTIPYHFYEEKFKKVLHPDAGFIDYLVNNEEKIIFVKNRD